jgi:hypothetical protein
VTSSFFSYDKQLSRLYFHTAFFLKQFNEP